MIPFRVLELRRGNKADLPTLADGEPGFCEDTGELFIGSLSGNKPLGFVAAVPGNWAGSPPTDLESAVNRLAAAVAGLLGSPIP